MKSNVRIVILALTAATAFAQGPLLPSGSPGPTMKSLDQLEPRIPITNIPFTITASGSYYITGNLTGTASSAGIIINADRVSLDLMGFTLQGLPDALDGIQVQNARNGITIRNGSVTGWGQDGIDLILNGSGSGALIEGVYVFGNTGAGLRANDNAVVVRVTARQNGVAGISAGQNSVIRESTARENGSTGIAGSINNVIENNTAQGNGGNGINSGNGSTVAGNVSRANTGNGIFANSGSRVIGNTVTTNGGSGIGVQSFSVVRDNTADANGYASATDAGISASLGHNRIENNTLTRNNIGLRATDSDNVVKDNIVKLSKLRNYEFGARNQLDLLLSEIPETIPWPALVRLAGSLTGGIGTNGITIAANDVTIDLQGHSLAGAPGSKFGIYARAVRNTTVRNGNVVHWDDGGVYMHSDVINAVVESIAARSNGLTGINIGTKSTARNCEASYNVGRGISCAGDGRIESCSVYQNGDSGVYMEKRGVVVDTFSADNNQHGFAASLVGSSVLFSRCNAENNGRHGFVLNSSCTLADSTASRNGGSGVWIDSVNNVIRGNHFDRNDERGIYALFFGNRIEQNHVTANSVGIEAVNPNNFIAGNTCIGNDTNFYVVAGNVCQVIPPAQNTTLINGNSGGVAAGSPSPWINFAY